jgi:hypothetical protein
MVHFQHTTVTAVSSGLFIVAIAIDVGVEKYLARGVSDDWGMAFHFTPLSSVACASRSKGREDTAGLLIVYSATTRPMVHA